MDTDFSFTLFLSEPAESNMPEGSWKCEKCNNINYPFRTKCNRQNCGAEKPSEAKKSPRSATDEDEQVCIRCFLFWSLCCMMFVLQLLLVHNKRENIKESSW